MIRRTAVSLSVLASASGGGGIVAGIVAGIVVGGMGSSLVDLVKYNENS